MVTADHPTKSTPFSNLFMTHRSTASLVNDLRQNGRLVEYDRPIDPKLEIAEIQRRVYLSGGPAILFSNVIGCRFPMAGNLFGSLSKLVSFFGKRLKASAEPLSLRSIPNQFFQKPFRYWKAPFTALAMRPKRVRSGRVLQNEIKLSELPQLKSWPDDGGSVRNASASPIPKILRSLIRRNRTWECTAFRWPEMISNTIVRSDCITKSIAGLVFIIKRR